MKTKKIIGVKKYSAPKFEQRPIDKDQLLVRAIEALESIAQQQRRANKMLIATLQTPLLNKFIFESPDPDAVNNLRLDLIKALKSK